MRLFKSIFLSFTIWILTALLNAVLAGSWLCFFSNAHDPWPAAYLLVFIGTLIFSIPGMFIFWIVLLINWEQDFLFRSLLKAGFIISGISSLVIYILPVDEVKGQQFFLSGCIVIASIASIMTHHSNIKSIYTIKKDENYA